VAGDESNDPVIFLPPRLRCRGRRRATKHGFERIADRAERRERTAPRIPLFSLWYGLAKLTPINIQSRLFHTSPSCRGGVDASGIGTGKQGPFRCATQRSPKQASFV
jgi:hypothetical protein